MLIWMAYDKENNRFLGSLSMWQPYHVEAYQFIPNDEQNCWRAEDPDVDAWLGAECEGNRPLSFEVSGYKGEWILMISPYT